MANQNDLLPLCTLHIRTSPYPLWYILVYQNEPLLPIVNLGITEEAPTPYGSNLFDRIPPRYTDQTGSIPCTCTDGGCRHHCN